MNVTTLEKLSETDFLKEKLKMWTFFEKKPIKKVWLQQIVVQDLDAGGFITKFNGHEKEVTKVCFVGLE